VRRQGWCRRHGLRISANQIDPQTGNRISLKTVEAETGEELQRSETWKTIAVLRREPP
jgi:hypothetical protein